MLTEHQLSHSAANIDPDEYLDDARSVAQEVLTKWVSERGPDSVNDATTDVLEDEFPDAVILDLLTNAGIRDSNSTAQNTLDHFGKIVFRIISHRPRSGHPDEKSNPDKEDAVGWVEHRARTEQLAERLKKIREDADAAVTAAGGRVRRSRQPPP